MASAQAPDPYLQLVRTYRTDPAPAAVSMARMSPDAIGAGSRRCGPTCARADLVAGAMLHLDVAEQLMGPNSEASLMHIRAGQFLLQAAHDKAVFARRWHALAARLFLAHGHPVAAAAILTEGRTRYKEAPEFFVALGLITEWRAGMVGVGWLATDLRGAAIRDSMFDLSPASTNPGSPPYRGSVLRDLERAYRRALAAEPTHAGARIRLAWVHVLAGDARVWEDVSAEFLATADAEATAVECLTLGDDPEHVDPWTLFRMGLMDSTTTRWLHDEARRP